jgi:hypothetical protein
VGGDVVPDGEAFEGLDLVLEVGDRTLGQEEQAEEEGADTHNCEGIFLEYAINLRTDWWI